ncbi:MAG: hypothetical protein JWO70_2012 [Betaproteobacteria bacterium]|nr:hypothetical protein [Betaproteobacteria bacterium]
MMIVDAVSSAPTRHSVYFLVTAYIESLRHFERTCGVPPMVLHLPVHSTADLAERLEALHCNTEVALEAVVAVSELAAVLISALRRLDTLEPGIESHADASRPHARSDSRRCALSV